MFVFQTVKHVVTNCVCVVVHYDWVQLWQLSPGHDFEEPPVDTFDYTICISVNRKEPIQPEQKGGVRPTLCPCPVSAKVTQVVYELLWLSFNANNRTHSVRTTEPSGGISWRPAGFVNVKKKPKLQIRVTRPNNPVRTLWCSSLKWCLDLNPKPEISFLSAHVPAWVKRRLMWAWEHFSAQCLSVSEQLCGWGLGGKKGLVSILIVKQCHSQNSKWGMGVTVSHFLTLRDKLDIFFMWRGETLFVMIVCRQSWSRVMVFLTSRTVENDLWSGKSERGTREVLCWFLQERKCSLSFPSRNFLKWYPISKKGWLSRSKKLQQLNEGPCDPRSHTHEQGQSAWLVQTKNHENPTE